MSMDQDEIDALGRYIAENAVPMTSDKTPTPRTDAHRLQPAARNAPADAVDADFARQLKTELAAKTRELAKAKVEAERLREDVAVIYDGNSVYAEMSVQAHSRTSAENVSDVLDSIARIWKAARAQGGERGLE